MSSRLSLSISQPLQPVFFSQARISQGWDELSQKTEDFFQKLLHEDKAVTFNIGDSKIYWRKSKATLYVEGGFFGHVLQIPLHPTLARASSESRIHRLWIACAAPITERTVAAVCKNLEKGHLVINLRHTREITEGQKDLYRNVLRTASQKDAYYYHYPDWEDQKAIRVEELDKLVGDIRGIEIEKQIQRIWIHCLGGVGRTGTVIAAIHLAESIEGADPETILENPSEWIIKEVQKCVLLIRRQRSSSCVAVPEQHRLLCEYGDFLVRNRFLSQRRHLLRLPQNA